MADDGALSFDALIRDTDFSAQLNRMERRMMGLGDVAQRETRRVDDSFRQLGGAIAGYFTGTALAGFVGELVKVRGEFQQLDIAFSTMLRSKEKGQQLMQEAVQLAAATPFELRDVAQGAKQLLAYGGNARTVISELRMLGDVASGVGVDLGSITYLYGTLRAQGRAYSVDIRLILLSVLTDDQEHVLI